MARAGIKRGPVPVTAVEVEEGVKVSLCVDCARHPSLTRLIEAKSVAGTCAFCCREDAPVRDPEDAEPMIMLIRALIRFYWAEYDYNSHWGGGPVLDLFEDKANPVVEPPVANTYLDEFDEMLQWPPYPERDEGVAIYAGFDADGVRLINFAISRTEPRGIRVLRQRLLIEDFDDVAPALEALIDPFLGDIEFVLPAGGLWHRARIGIEAEYKRIQGWESDLLRKPLTGIAIGAPPAAVAGVGRLNRAGVPVLYLASKPYTALAEIRPHPGHHVSIGGFETLTDVRMADFDPDIALFSANDSRLDLFEIIQSLDRLMSAPVTPDDKAGYLLTQLLAEVLVRRGIDGVRYRSSVSDGINICIFDPARAAFVDGHSEVRYVESVSYEAPLAPSLTMPGPDDYLLEH